MKLEIDIDEKEFGHDIADHFQDFFKRLQAEIKTRLISDDTLVCGACELETIDMLLTAFKNATIEQDPKTRQIIIKTMTNLPEHCYDCPCHNRESGYCQADKEHRHSVDRPFWCPLEESEE